jgi:hypothetical protein
MRKLLALCGAVICFSFAASAQDSSTALAAADLTVTVPSPAPSPTRYSTGETFPWKLSVSYQLIRIRPNIGANFNLHGFDASVTRFVNDWFGIEGNVGAAFGDTPSTFTDFNPTAPSLRAKLIQYGGGPHIVYRNSSRIEPWGHIILGGTHIRLTQTAAGPVSVNALAYSVGGGADFKLGPRAFWRAEADFFATRYFSTFQKNFQIKTGLVLNF